MLSQRRRHAASAFAIAKRRAAQALLPKPSPADLAARLKVVIRLLECWSRAPVPIAA